MTQEGKPGIHVVTKEMPENARWVCFQGGSEREGDKSTCCRHLVAGKSRCSQYGHAGEMKAYLAGVREAPGGGGDVPGV